MEEGTEAAAATAVVMGVLTAAARPERPKEPEPFHVDHPFLFLLPTARPARSCSPDGSSIRDSASRYSSARAKGSFVIGRQTHSWPFGSRTVSCIAVVIGPGKGLVSARVERYLIHDVAHGAVVMQALQGIRASQDPGLQCIALPDGADGIVLLEVAERRSDDCGLRSAVLPTDEAYLAEGLAPIGRLPQEAPWNPVVSASIIMVLSRSAPSNVFHRWRVPTRCRRPNRPDISAAPTAPR
jgi:Serpin (serine protease inhibitor)